MILLYTRGEKAPFHPFLLSDLFSNPLLDFQKTRLIPPSFFHLSPPCHIFQVRLTLETVAPVEDSNAGDTSSTRKTKASPPVSQLVRLLWGEDTAELQMSIGHIPHVVMYLSLKLDSASPQEEVSVN